MEWTCPVCGGKRSGVWICPDCGFDLSLDCERYATLTQVLPAGAAPAASLADRRQEQERQAEARLREREAALARREAELRQAETRLQEQERQQARDREELAQEVARQKQAQQAAEEARQQEQVDKSFEELTEDALHTAPAEQRRQEEAKQQEEARKQEEARQQTEARRREEGARRQAQLAKKRRRNGILIAVIALLLLLALVIADWYLQINGETLVGSVWSAITGSTEPEYEYDEDGNVTSEQYYEDGVLVKTWYEYDEDGNISHLYTNRDGKLTYSASYSGGTISEETTYENDADGHMTRVTTQSYGSEGMSELVYEYEYDGDGHPVEGTKTVTAVNGATDVSRYANTYESGALVSHREETGDGSWWEEIYYDETGCPVRWDGSDLGSSRTISSTGYEITYNADGTIDLQIAEGYELVLAYDVGSMYLDLTPITFVKTDAGG
ncbi:MAG: hypothetical protein LUC48_04575 [Clostridiales bacterium]|nr:hypothetical protein [Clostridiales bacterium]